MSYRGSSEMFQIHTQWWFFLTAIGNCGFLMMLHLKSMVSSSYNCYVSHWMCYRGSSEMSQIHVQWSHFSEVNGYYGFWCCFITKIWSVIIWTLLCSSVGSAMGGLPKCPKFTCSGHTFWRWMVTMGFDDVSLQKCGQPSYEHWCVL